MGWARYMCLALLTTGGQCVSQKWYSRIYGITGQEQTVRSVLEEMVRICMSWREWFHVWGK